MSGQRTVIAGGTLATDYGVFAADVVIEDGRVAAIADQVVTFLDDDYEVALGWPGDERTERLIEALSAVGRRIERRIDLLD